MRRASGVTTWRNRVYTTGTAFILSGITVFLWNRNQTPAEFSVQPTRCRSAVRSS